MSIGDVIALGAVILWLLLVLFYMRKKRKEGKCAGCSGGTCAFCEKKEAETIGTRKKY